MNTIFAQPQSTRTSSFASPQTAREPSFAPRPFATPKSQDEAQAPSQEPYEREAKRVAGQVMRSARSGDGTSIPPALASTSMSKPAVSYSGAGGRPLPEPIRHRLGQSLGADLSSVRVHTDARADRLNRSLDSNAATVGGNIFFRHGEYQPESRAGQELIAHEAVHTVHQGAVEQSGEGDAGATIGLRQSPMCGPQRSGNKTRKKWVPKETVAPSSVAQENIESPRRPPPLSIPATSGSESSAAAELSPRGETAIERSRAAVARSDYVGPPLSPRTHAMAKKVTQEALRTGRKLPNVVGVGRDKAGGFHVTESGLKGRLAIATMPTGATYDPGREHGTRGQCKECALRHLADHPVETSAEIWMGNKPNPFPLVEGQTGRGSYMKSCSTCKKAAGQGQLTFQQ